jgi:hypothetical protein
MRARTKPRDFPNSGRDIMTQDVEIAVNVLHLEVAVAQPESSRRLLASVSRVTLDVDNKKCRRV